MIDKTMTLGIIGNGMLGQAIAQAWLEHGMASTEQLWIANRRGRSDSQTAHPSVHFTTDIQQLADACDTVVLCVPPANAPDVSFTAHDRLVISVMAGVNVERLSQLAHSGRIIRAMTSPAAARGLAYSPWFSSDTVDDTDRLCIKRFFDACGTHDEIQDESQLDLFTAMVGPVPGFVACFAQAMIKHALSRGVDPLIAERAVKQLFLASGTIMSDSKASPEALVQEMIDYAGTTAAGLLHLEQSTFAETLSEGLDAATRAARDIAS